MRISNLTSTKSSENNDWLTEKCKLVQECICDTLLGFQKNWAFAIIFLWKTSNIFGHSFSVRAQFTFDKIIDAYIRLAVLGYLHKKMTETITMVSFKIQNHHLFKSLHFLNSLPVFVTFPYKLDFGVLCESNFYFSCCVIHYLTIGIDKVGTTNNITWYKWRRKEENSTQDSFNLYCDERRVFELLIINISIGKYFLQTHWIEYWIWQNTFVNKTSKLNYLSYIFGKYFKFSW